MLCVKKHLQKRFVDYCTKFNSDPFGSTIVEVGKNLTINISAETSKD